MNHYLNEGEKRRMNREAIAKPIKKDNTQLLPRRKTRRGKRKKKEKDSKWKKEFEEAMKVQKQMKKERAQQFQDFARLIEKD